MLQCKFIDQSVKIEYEDTFKKINVELQKRNL